MKILYSFSVSEGSPPSEQGKIMKQQYWPALLFYKDAIQFRKATRSRILLLIISLFFTGLFTNEVTAQTCINPYVITPCYINGDPLPSGSPAAGNTAWVAVSDDGTTVLDVATTEEVGSLWGQAYDGTNNLVYGSAVLKRHVGLGTIDGVNTTTGGIYTISFDPNTNTFGSAMPWLDVNTLPGVNTGQDPRVEEGIPLPTDPNTPSTDALAFATISKRGLGGIAITPDGSTLYAVNLFDNTILTINTATQMLVRPPVSIPDPGCSNVDWRPWALKYHNGTIYVGGVCTAETSNDPNDLHAYMYEYDGATGFTNVFDFNLGSIGDRGKASFYTDDDAIWQPWLVNGFDPDFTAQIAGLIPPIQDVVYPQPIFADIEFLDNGDLVMGFMDRLGLQMGNRNNLPDGSFGATGYQGTVAGDVMHACSDGMGSWTLENHTTACSTPSAGSGGSNGLGGGEYYVGETLPGHHDETAFGALAYLPMSNRIVAPGFDPNGINEGGLYWLSTVDGTNVQDLTLYSDSSTPGSANKAVGLGGIEYLCLPPCINPTATVTPSMGMCVGGVVADNASIALSAVMDGEEAGISPGATYSGPDYGDAANIDVSGGSGTFPNLVHNTQYTIRVFNMYNACFTDYTVTTPMLLLPTVILTDPSDECIDGSDMSFTGMPTDANGSFTSTAGAGFTDNGDGTASLDVSAAGAGSYDVTYTYTDGNGCTASQTVSVTILAGVIANNAELALCDEGGGVATFDLTDAEDPMAVSNLASGMAQDVDGGQTVTVTYHTGSPATVANQIVSPNMYSAANGTNVVALVTAGNGCTAEATVTLSVFTLPSIAFTKIDDTDCLNPNSGSIDITASGGAGGYTYDWADIVGTNDLEDRTGLAAGSYTVTVTDANGCTETETITILAAECVAVGNYVFMDTNDNGTFEMGTDMPIENVLVELYVSTATPGVDAALLNTMTNANGYYYFDNLNAGDYIVYIPASNFGTGQPLENKESYPGADGTDTSDGDDNGMDTPVNGGITSNTFTLTPNNEPTGEDQTDYPGILDDDDVNGTIDFTFVVVPFDLALTKVETSTGPYVPGSDVTYTIEVFNQGGLDATGVEVTDYIPTGMSLNDGAWTDNMDGTATILVGDIASGASATVTITLTIDANFMGTSLVNYAEISNADNAFNVPDEDSIPGDNQGDDELGTDNDIDDEAPGTPGTADNPADNDDYDPAGITITQEFDLALTKVLNTTGTIVPGDDVTYTIEVFNQGTLDATGVEVTDYIPTGMSLNDGAWTDNMDGTATILVGDIASGASATVTITLTIDANFMGTSLVNYAEISDADNALGLPDEDSTPGDNQGTDELGTDNDIDDEAPGTPGTADNPADNDDYDPASTPITQEFDLALTKVLNTTGTIVPGDDVTYTIEVFNQGTLDATGVEVTDYIPTGMSLNDGAWTDNMDGTATILVGDIASGASATVTITLTIDANFMGTSLVNYAEISNADNALGLPDEDSTPGDNQGTDELGTDNDIDDEAPGTPGTADNPADNDDYDPASTPITQEFDLALTKVLNTTGTIVPGDDVTYTIEVFNQGTLDATGVEVTDYIPTGMSLNDGAWTDNMDGTATILVGDIASGASATVTITLTIDANFMGTSLVNYAEISNADNALGLPDEDSTPGDNQGTDELGTDNDIDDEAPGTPGTADNPADNDDYDPAGITITQEFDLALTKVLNTTGTIVPGDDVTYTIEVFNQGTLDATGVEVTDYIPTGMSLNDGAWTDNMDGTATILVGDIASGASATVTITLTIDANFMGTSLVNYAEISNANNALGLPDEDSTPGDNQGTDELGTDDDIDDEAPGTPGTADNPADNDDYDPASTPITQEFDLALTKVLNTTGTIVPGNDVTYTIEVFNQGTLDATGVEVTDYIPTGMSLNDGAWTDNMDGTATILVGDIASGASATVTITLTVDANFMGTSLVNYAEISNANNVLGLPDEDSTPGDNQGTDELGTDDDIDDEAPGTPGTTDNPADNDDYDPASTPITQEFDLALTKVLNTTGTIVPGNDVTYTIEVFNQGTLDATGVEVTDYIPTGMSLNDGAWTDNMDGTATILVGDIASGASATVTITLTIDANFMGTSLVNYAEISDADNALGLPDEDSTPGDNQGTDELGTDNDIDDEAPGTPGTADNPADNDDYDPAGITITQEFDLALTKVLNTTGTIVPGDDVTYTIEVFNQGTLDATGVEVTDYIPTGMSLNDGAWTDNMDGTATILVGDIASGASATVTITLTVDANFMGTSLVNYAEISNANNVLGLPDEDSTPGDNQGTDELGTDDDIDDEAPGTPGTTDNPADNDDYDPASTPITQEFDLALTKVLNTTGTIVPGNDVTYTIEVFNQGTLDATGVEVTDYIPTGMSLNDGAWTDNMDGTATILVGDITSGASATVTITLTIDANFMGTSLVNYAEISDADNALGLPDEDSTPGDNQGTDELGTDNDIDDEAPGTPGTADNPADNDDYDPASTPITQEFDLALTKVLNTTGTIVPGNDVTYTIEVFNQGGLDATGVEVTDYIPTGMSLNDGAWTDNMDGTATILVGDIASGASATLTITLTVDANFMGTSLVNYAEISDADNALGLPDEDSTPGDNQGTDELGTDDDIDDEAPGTPGTTDNPADNDDYDPAGITITQEFDLALTKVLNTTGTIVPGDDVTYTIEVFNQGTLDATGVEVTDYIPTGMSLNDGAWTDNMDGTATILVGDIASGASATVTITLTIDANFMGTSLVNYAEISNADNALGLPDEDSTPGDNQGTDELGTDNDIDDEAPGTPGTADNPADNDDYDPAGITITQEFDLALTKVLNTTGTIVPGDDVTYTIEVFNQGTLDATGVEVTDYIPTGMSLNDGAWTDNMDGTATILVGDITSGASATVTITLTIDANFMGTSLVNYAEISDADNALGLPDEDSTPGDNQGTDELGTDNDIDDEAPGTPGTADNPADNDDYDPASTPITQEFDLALTKVLNTTGTIVPGDDVTYTIEVFNQGGLDATGVEVTDYIPTGMSLNDGAWTDNMDGTATILVGDIASGASATVTITLTVDANFMGTSLVNYAEISDADNALGLPDEDSTPGDNQGTDELGTDDDIDDEAPGTPGTTDNPADNDDYDGATIAVNGLDYGDLPNSYTTAGAGSPAHIITMDLILGSCVDAELDGQPEAMAGAMTGGDDNNSGAVTFGNCTANDDEDGIDFVTPLVPGNEACIEVTATNNTGNDAVLQMWVDFNGNDVFDLGEEVIFTSVNGNTIPDGGVIDEQYCFEVPVGASFQGGAAYVRFRLSPNGGLPADGQTGGFPLGEIEDYKVTLYQVGSYVWLDINNDGQQPGDFSGAFLNDVELQLIYAGPDGDLNTTADNQVYITTPEQVNGLNGQFLFSGLVPGTYQLSMLTIPPGFEPTTIGSGSDTNDSNDPNGFVFTIPDGGSLPTGENGVGDMPGGAGYPDSQDNWSFDFGLITDGYTITCNCDGSITIDWVPFAGGDNWTVTLEDMNGNPALNFVNMPESEVTIAPGSLNNLECYALAISENIGLSEVSSIQGYVCDLCYEVPEITLTGTGPSCEDSTDGEATITITEHSCMATYDVYLTSQNGADVLVGDDIQITAPIVVPGLGEDTYGVRMKLVDRGNCAYGDDCFPLIKNDLLFLQNTDTEPPTKVVYDASGAEVTDMVITYDALPEGECGVQFTWSVVLDDNCLSAGVNLAASITTSSTNPSVSPSASVTVLDNTPTYAVEVFAGVGTNTLTLTATDANGNENVMVYTINVADNRDPVLYCPTDMNVEIPSCEDEAPVNWTVSVVDDCDLSPTLTQTAGPASGDVLSPGIHNVSYEASDDYGNTGSCSFTITVTQAPSPAPIVDVSGNGNYEIEHCEEDGLIVFSGNVYDCDLDAASFNPADLIVQTIPLSADAAGSLQISYTLPQDGYVYFEATGDLTAGSYLIITTYQGVTVDHGVIVSQDADEPAVIDMPGNLSYQAADCEAEVPVSFAVQLSDDCDEDMSSAIFTVNGAPAPPYDAAASNPTHGLYVWNLNLSAGTYTIVGTYTDGGGNTTVQEATITVNGTQDDWGPIITYPSQNMDIALDPCGPNEQEACFEVSATDDCSGDILPLVLVEDENGNPVTVDNPDGNTYCIEEGSGSYTVSISATDAAGNTTTEDFVVNITQDTPPLAALICNDDLNVTLDANCQREITADMLLEGEFGCYVNEDFAITIQDDDPSNGNILDGCGEFIYEISLIGGSGPIDFQPCWGYITGEDKTAPVLECPANTGTGTIVKNGYVLSGTIDTNDPTVVVNDWSCLIDNTQGSFPGERYVDIIPFQVDESDVYTFLVESDITQTGNVGFAIYQGGYDVDNPCEHIIAQADIPQAPGVGNPLPGSQGNDGYVRLALPLQAGATYYLATTTFTPEATGNYQYSICSDENGQVGYFDTTYVTNPDWSVDEIISFTPVPTTPVTIDLPLHCEDFDAIYNNPSSLSLVGSPIVSDNCDQDVEVTFEDSYEQFGDCGDIVITRTFTAVDDKGNSSSCTQVITLSSVIANNRGDTEVWLPPFTVPIECDEDYPTLANGNPTPAIAGYPFVYTVSGIYDLTQGQYCNVGASFEDSPSIVVCDGAFKFTRTWTIVDWCNPIDFYTYSQIIKVGDFTAPTVTCPGEDYDWDGVLDAPVYSTSPFACTAAFEVPLPAVEDNCSDYEVYTEIVTAVEVDVVDQYGQVTGTELDTVTVRIVEWDAASRYVSGIPMGAHYFYYSVEDDCGNQTEVYCPFSVEDQIEPTAVCDDDLHVSIAGNDYARIYAEDINEGSWDNCGIASIEVRRNLFDPINFTCGSTYSTWGDYVDFFCCDAGVEIEIQLRVIDESGNVNTCWLTVTPEEKVRPYCEAPHNVEVDCTELPYDFDAYDTDQLEELFGSAIATDNCSGAAADELPPVVDLECGFGRIIRRFRATDGAGNQSTNFCQQIVDIDEVHNYEIRFPADAEAVCGVAEPDSVIYEELACDLLAVSHTDEFFSASGEECYKIFRTWKVINWCEYDGESAPMVIGRDEDCDGQPGDEAVWVLRRPNGYTYIDRDDDETEPNNVPLAFQNICQGWDDFWRKEDTTPGYYEYTQIIKVYDDIDPEITGDDQTFCSYDNVNCDGVVAYEFSVEENCTPEDLTIKVFLDAGADGVVDVNLTETNSYGFSLTGTYPDYVIGGEYPIGCHAFEVHVEDGCGNVNAQALDFCVEDCKAPAPICINGLAIELMPFDVDGDDVPDEGRMAIWASDFIASPITDCSEPIKYSINRSGDAANIDSTSIVLTCADTGTLVIEIWAWDAAGNSDFCETYILVQDNMNSCGTPGAAAAGAVNTEVNAPVEGVNVSLSGQGIADMETSNAGEYMFANLEEGYDYTITPQLDGDYLNGVSTFDLVLISQHILGVQLLDSPYKMIAADVNNSESITTLDLIQLRKLILSIETEFTNNTSWRFVDADFAFPQPSNPWMTQFPEVININNLSSAGDFNNDFVAVKIGDVNLDAETSSLVDVEGRTVAGALAFEVAEEALKAGNEYTVAFTAPSIAAIAGYQATLTFNTEAVELVDVISGVATEKNFGLAYVDEGLITTSWNGEAAEGVMFSLVLRATADANLSEVLGVSSRITKAEAYDHDGDYLDVAIEFNNGTVAAAGFELYQNTPNPFKGETVIGFNLPEAGIATLTISDVTGKTIKLIRLDGVKGYNSVVLNAHHLPKGVLQYTLRAGEHTDTKPMIIAD